MTRFERTTIGCSLGLLLGATAGYAQATALPPTKPTAYGPPVTAPAPAVRRVAARPEVTYAGGQLAVNANGAGLNTILREIARQTGMKITGSVASERVYGSYGPASAGVVLGDLLDGTGSNMVLQEDASAVPVELILTPRAGGPTPPSANAVADEVDLTVPDAVAPMAQTAPVAPPVTEPARLPFSQTPATPAVTDTQRTPLTPDPGGSISAPTIAPATEPGTTPGPQTQSTGTSDPAAPASPNGVKTPQQIFEQLQRMQQQQQQPPAPQ